MQHYSSILLASANSQLNLQALHAILLQSEIPRFEERLAMSDYVLPICEILEYTTVISFGQPRVYYLDYSLLK